MSDRRLHNTKQKPPMHDERLSPTLKACTGPGHGINISRTPALYKAQELTQKAVQKPGHSST